MAPALAHGRSREPPAVLADPLVATAQQLSTPSISTSPLLCFFQTLASCLIKRVLPINLPSDLLCHLQELGNWGPAWRTPANLASIII
ncbi:hypothetical protein N7516_006671 [Penicillium verrucosum]|uniref:uncharacterized protein n=1 Tax=Penicillium verrucosum TaxID=60171 RepID=UPI002545741E|nr:uncharacterized protein N7516_006671 [Penicillium verrucosum]KAJ5932182.1 hypothetical protein N7516_006671 [Penicillium verrucosum]